MTEPTPEAPAPEAAPEVVAEVPAPEAPADTPIVDVPTTAEVPLVPTDVDDTEVHAPEDGDLIAEFKERVTGILDRLVAAADAVRDKLAVAEASSIHEIHDLFSEVRGVARDLVPSQTLLKTPSPSLDPNHPQGLGRTLQPGETLQTGVV